MAGVDKMTIHEFDFKSFNTGQEEQQSFVPKPKIENNLPGERETPIIDNLGDPGARINDERNLENCHPCKSDDDIIDVNFVEDVRETYPVGFKLMDRGIKNYFSGIRIPTGSGLEHYTILPVRISAADPDTLIYSDQHLRGGRIELPFLAITRTDENYDNKRYSPPIRHIFRHMLNCGKKSELVYRPIPYLINYTLDIMSEHKSEAEYALFSIISKLNPIGSFFLEERSMGMAHEVILNPINSADNSDLETDPNTRQYIRKTITISMEGWLPTPTKVVPNILAKPLSIKEGVGGIGNEIKIPGETFAVIRDQSINTSGDQHD